MLSSMSKALVEDLESDPGPANSHVHCQPVFSDEWLVHEPGCFYVALSTAHSKLYVSPDPHAAVS